MSDHNKRKLEGHTLPLYSKRAYHGDVNPSREYVEPKLYQQPNYVYDNSSRKGTDFATWTEEEIKVFLDERGGDFDDCNSFQDLVERAIETEINTGPARKPPRNNTAAAEAQSAGGNAAASSAQAADDAEYDPLEAFMAEINEVVAANKPNKPTGQAEAAACDEAADPATEYMAVRAARAVTSTAAIAASVAAEGYDSDEEVYATARALQAQADAEGGGGVDSDDELKAAAAKARTIDPLAPTDHTAIEYDDFAKDFYTEHPTIAAMSVQQVNDYRRDLEIHVSGFDPPKPIQSFGQAGFDHLLLGAIKKAGYDKPTAIQAQALPAVLSGRDVLGLAKTGSGKTAAFVLPMLVHIMDQPELAKGAGPIGLILAPTRELSEQIHKETRKFSKPYGLRCVAAFGGLSKFEQFKELKAGAEIAVATPGRMMDLIRMKACTTQRVTYLVLDEADRMFDMGFEQQVHSLLDAVRPDRQTLLFSATLPRKIEALVAKALNDPVRISVGQLGAANRDVSQRVEVLKSDQAKLDWLLGRLPNFIDEGDVLLFAGQRAKVDEVASALTAAGFKTGAIHGDMDQFSRMAVLDAFRSGQHHLLVATDVAARGLDIKSIKTVINFDAARDIDTHIHRVGRTGRAGDKEGVAVTLLVEGSNRDAHFAGLLVSSLTLGGQEVPRDLYGLAMKDARFRKGSNRGKGGKRGKGGRRKGPQVGGAGLGFGAKPQQQQSSSEYGEKSAFTGNLGGVGKPPQEFVQLPGFARSHDDYEHESSAAAATAAVQQQQPVVQPPPWATAVGGFSSGAAAAAAVGGSNGIPINFPPPPPLPHDNHAAAPPPPPLPTGPPPPAAAAAVHNDDDQYDPTAAAAAAAAAPPLPPGPPPAATADISGSVDGSSTMAAARKELVQTAYASRMKSQFVSSGHRGGDIGQAATIIAPKVFTSSPAAAAAAGPGSSSSSSRPVFRPPVPVTQRPMYLTRPSETITRGRGPPPRQQQQQTAPMAGAAAAAAIAQAQAVAARLAAQAGGVQPGAVAVGGVAQPQQIYTGLQQQQQQPPYAGNQPQVQEQEQQQPYQGYQQQQQQQVGGGPAGGVAAAVAAAQAIAARLAAQHQGSEQ